MKFVCLLKMVYSDYTKQSYYGSGLSSYGIDQEMRREGLKTTRHGI